MVSLVASRSVALPLPSSPHWAPSTTIAGIAALLTVSPASGGPKETAPAQVHRGSCGVTLPHRSRTPTAIRPARPEAVDYCPAVDPMLVITNADAGTADQETLDRALAILRERRRSRWPRPPTPASSTACCTAPGSRRIVVAGGDGSLHAVVAALHRRHELAGTHAGPAPARHRQRLRPRHRHPAGHRGGGPAGARGRAAPGRPDRRRDRRGRRQQRARRRRRPGQPQGPQVEGAARLDRRRQGQPRQARLPDRRPARRLPPAAAAGCASRSTARSSTTSTSRC